MTCQRTEYRLNLLPVATVALLALAALFAVIPAASAQHSAPETPGKPTAKAVFQGGVDLEWNEVPGAESYDVQLHRNGQWIGLPGDGVAIAFYGAGAIISQLNHEGSLYWFQVRANNAHGSSDWSGFISHQPTSGYADGRRARPGNTPATGVPVVSGKAEAGATLAASVADIADGNGLDRVQFHYQWTSGEGSGESDIDGAAGASYTVRPDDAGRTVRVRVAFTDRGGYQESLASSPVQVAGGSPPANTPATGAPTIGGTVQVSRTLTAVTTGIADADGLTSVSYSYQWVAGGSEIDGATGSSYTLPPDQHGRAIKVRVTFTDDRGNEESLVSTAIGVVAASGPVAAEPTGLSNTATHNSVTLTWDDPGVSGITHYQIFRRDRAVHGPGEFVLIEITAVSAATYTDDTVEAAGSYEYRVKAVNTHGLSVWSNYSRIDLASDDTTPTPTSTPTPTQQPTVASTPTAQERPDLYKQSPMPKHMATVYWHWQDDGTSTHDSIEIDFTIHNDVGDFSDRNGLYLLLGGSEVSGVVFYFGLQTDVHKPDVGDVGKGIVFSRWKTRDLSNARVAPTGFSESSGHEGDFIGVRRPYDWTAGDYRARLARSESDLTGDWFGLWITEKSTGRTTWAGSLRFPRMASDQPAEITSYVISSVEVYGQPVRPIDIPEWHISILAPMGDSNSPPDYADRVYLSGEIQNSDAEYSDDPNRIHIRLGGDTERKNVQGGARNRYWLPKVTSAATGLPAISGTAQVGETLAADTSYIADEDGLTNVSYSYQWIADDADIGGASASAYTLADSDEGKTIQVKVSFTDDAGNAETLTSAATEAVAATPSVTVELSPSGSVEEGTAITVTMSFANLESDSDTSDTDYVFRADVRNTDGCEGSGMGNDRYMYQVDEDPEVRTGSISASCAPGDYTVEVSISSPGNVELASATADFTVNAPEQQQPESASTDATLSGLDLSGVDFGAFDPATSGYTAEVDHDVRETTVTATVNDDGASYLVKLDGAANADGTVSLAEGSNVITVEVTAEDGETAKTYTVTVTRAAPPLSTDATLSGLTLSDAPFTFASDTTSYDVNVAHDVDQTTVTATAKDDGATYAIKLDGVADADGVIPLAEGSNVITVEVTAEDGNTGKTYKVTVSRAAPAAPPDAPDQPTGEVPEPGKVTLDWEDVDGATGYQVGLWSQPNLVPLPSADMPGVTVQMNGSGARLSGLPAEWSHYWLKVRASNGGGASGWSDWLALENS